MTFSNATLRCAQFKPEALPQEANTNEQPESVRKPSAMEYQQGFASSGGV